VLSDAEFAAMYPWARRIAEVHAASIVRAHRLSNEDYADLVQEGVAALWQSFGRFNQNRGCRSTFAETVIANRLISVARTQTAVKRGIRVCESLSSIGAGVEPAVYQPDPCLRLDVGRILDRAPAELQRIVLMLAEYGPAQVSSQTGLSRAVVYRRILALRAIPRQRRVASFRRP
jgi:RNA polymerase sigma factor (sigma-70 family)